jgi:response regulator of citrate/malate metabolism
MRADVLENLAILIIEDDISLQLSLKKYLGVIHEVTVVGSIEETLNLLNTLKSKKFELVLLDKGLPDGNGLELIPQIL